MSEVSQGCNSSSLRGSFSISRGFLCLFCGSKLRQGTGFGPFHFPWPPHVGKSGSYVWLPRPFDSTGLGQTDPATRSLPSLVWVRRTLRCSTRRTRPPSSGAPPGRSTSLGLRKPSKPSISVRRIGGSPSFWTWAPGDFVGGERKTTGPPPKVGSPPKKPRVQAELRIFGDGARVLEEDSRCGSPGLRVHRHLHHQGAGSGRVSRSFRD